MDPGYKRFNKKFQPLMDQMSRLDCSQEVRDDVARAVADGLEEAGDRDFLLYRETFELVASDPLVSCAGRPGGPCPEGREIRIGMHLRAAPDGRSAAWRSEKPNIRCIPCGAAMLRAEEVLS